MKLLIDSSTNFLYLAVISPSKNAFEIREGHFDHSETLVDKLRNFLETNNIKVADINEVYVGRGPGSYTGVRIAGTVAKVFAYATNINFYSFSSLDLILACALKSGYILARIVAKKDHSYYKLINFTSKIETVINDTFSSDEELSEKINNFPSYFEITPELAFSLVNSETASMLLDNFETSSEDVITYVPNYLRSVL